MGIRNEKMREARRENNVTFQNFKNLFTTIAQNVSHNFSWNLKKLQGLYFEHSYIRNPHWVMGLMLRPDSSKVYAKVANVVFLILPHFFRN